jgi:mannose-1-phosphate guanylyltransferase/mannose-6-phosphate isomerase
MTSQTSLPIIPVILSGGEGTRLWPLSRASFPKQLQAIVTEQSLLQDAIARLSGDGFAQPIIVCGEEHRFVVAQQARMLGIEPSAIVLEPIGRNTAPAVALAALLATEQGGDALLFVAPSDHVVGKLADFHRAIETARVAAMAGHLVTFGITPSAAETGYGYIRRGDALSGCPDCFRAAAFVEKPNLDTAKKYLADGGYAWNSGMFLFSARAYLAELSRHRPEMARLTRDALSGRSTDLDFIRPHAEHFRAIEGDSIDYAVMERTERAAVVPVDIGWNDVGSWSALWDIGKRDDGGNVAVGDVLLQNVKGSYVRSDGPLVAALGIENAVVVATDDAVLVTSRDQAQSVKDIVTALKSNKRGQSNEHTRVYRPWGWYVVVNRGPGFQVKLITIDAGHKISLQRHHQRAEHWVVVSGRAQVTRGAQIFELGANESTFIPIGETHRLESIGTEPLQVVEVATGAYLGEDDIERFDDQYGRN